MKKIIPVLAVLGSAVAFAAYKLKKEEKKKLIDLDEGLLHEEDFDYDKEKEILHKTFQNTRDEFEEVKEDFSETVEEVKEELSETAEEVKEKTEDSFDGIKDTYEDVKEQMEDTLDTAKEKASEVYQDVKETFEDVKEQVVEEFDKFKGQAENTVEEVKEKATSRFRRFRSKAEDKVDGIKEKAEDVLPEFAPKTEIEKLMQESAKEIDKNVSSEIFSEEYPHITVTMLEEIRSMTVEAIAALAADGDVHEQERPVQHMVTFSSKEDMESFKSRVINKGFVITKGEDEHSLVVLHISLIEEDKLMENILYLAEQAYEFHGEYRGWQSKVSR